MSDETPIPADPDAAARAELARVMAELEADPDPWLEESITPEERAAFDAVDEGARGEPW